MQSYFYMFFTFLSLTLLIWYTWTYIVVVCNCCGCHHSCLCLCACLCLSLIFVFINKTNIKFLKICLHNIWTMIDVLIVVVLIVVFFFVSVFVSFFVFVFINKTNIKLLFKIYLCNTWTFVVVVFMLLWNTLYFTLENPLISIIPEIFWGKKNKFGPKSLIGAFLRLNIISIWQK